MPEPLTITASQAAQLLGVATETFYRSVTAMKRNHGFPAPVPGSRRYSRQAVVDWINGSRPPITSPGLEAAVASAEDILLQRARAKLAAD